MKTSRRFWVIILTAFLFIPCASWADGMFIPPEPPIGVRPINLGDLYSVKYHRVNIEIQDQMATTTVDQAIVNETDRQLEITYVFPLPRNAQVKKFSLIVGDREISGRLLSRDEARREYERIVRTRKDPALLEYLGNGMFQSSVFPIPPHGERTVKLVYSELLRKEGDRVEYMYPLNTEKFSKKPLNKVEIKFDLKSNTPIKNVYSPTHDTSPAWDGNQHVTGKWSDENVKPDQDFRLFWNLTAGELGATLYTFRPDDKEDGYFLFLASPEIAPASKKVINKDVVLVLDRSGSMSDDGKIKQAIGAASFIVRNLQEGDKFNVIFYNDSIDPLWNTLKEYNAENSKEALNKIADTTATSNTDIHDALMTAMKMMPDDSRPHYLIFLTDGLPTAGITDLDRISNDVTKANTRNTRLFVFGVGNDVNAILLDRLGANNHGLADYVLPTESIEGKVSRFYSKIQSPALTDVALNFGNIRVRDSYPRELPDLFHGEQMVLVGRYRDTGPATIVLTGTAAGQKRTYNYKVDFSLKTDPEDYSFIARLWAQKKIGWLIEQIRLHGENKEAVNEIVSLSTRFGIITEYTAFLADEGGTLNAADNAPAAEAIVRKRAGVATGAGGVSQSVQSKTMQNAAQAPTSAQKYYDEYGQQVTAQNIKIIGAKTFYLKKGVWTDAEYREGMPIVNVSQMTDAYFNLANTDTTQAKYMTFTTDKPIIVVIGNKAYKIAPQAQ